MGVVRHFPFPQNHNFPNTTWILINTPQWQPVLPSIIVSQEPQPHMALICTIGYWCRRWLSMHLMWHMEQYLFCKHKSPVVYRSLKYFYKVCGRGQSSDSWITLTLIWKTCFNNTAMDTSQMDTNHEDMNVAWWVLYTQIAMLCYYVNAINRQCTCIQVTGHYH